MSVGGLWAGPYLQVVHGFDPVEASWALLAMITTANVGTFFYGPLDRRLGGRRRVVLGGARQSPVPHWTALTAFAGVGGGAVAFVLFRARGRHTLPVKDPFLPDSLRYAQP